MARKVVLITGANSGIGLEVSRGLLASSQRVILGCRDIAKASKVLERLQREYPNETISALELDITNDESIDLAVAKIRDEFGVLDSLVNNAGVVITNAASRRSEIIETLNTNAVSHLVLTEQFIPLLQKSEDPRIVNVSSALGSISGRLNSDDPAYNITSEAYRMSKACLNMATACIHASYKSSGVKVWAFCPGYVITNLTGADDKQRRRETGAITADKSAAGVIELLEGKKDHRVGHFIQIGGKLLDW